MIHFHLLSAWFIFGLLSQNYLAYNNRIVDRTSKTTPTAQMSNSRVRWLTESGRVKLSDRLTSGPREIWLDDSQSVKSSDWLKSRPRKIWLAELPAPKNLESIFLNSSPLTLAQTNAFSFFRMTLSPVEGIILAHNQTLVTSFQLVFRASWGIRVDYCMCVRPGQRCKGCVWTFTFHLVQKLLFKLTLTLPPPPDIQQAC